MAHAGEYSQSSIALRAAFTGLGHIQGQRWSQSDSYFYYPAIVSFCVFFLPFYHDNSREKTKTKMQDPTKCGGGKVSIIVLT